MGCNRITLPARQGNEFLTCLNAVGGLDWAGMTAYLSAPGIVSYLNFDPSTKCVSWKDVSTLGGGVTLPTGTGVLGSTGTSPFWLNTTGVVTVDNVGNPSIITGEGLIYKTGSGTSSTINIPTDTNGMVLTVIGGHPQWAFPAAAASPPWLTKYKNIDGITGKYVTGLQSTFQATEVCLTDGSGSITFVQWVGPYTLNLANSGINGLDTGTVQANKWYMVFMVANSAGTAVGVVASLYLTAPQVMPSGYTYYARIGAIFTSSSGQINPFFQSGNRIATAQTAFNAITHSGGVAQLITGNYANLIPPNAITVDLLCSVIGLSGVTNELVQVFGDPSASRVGVHEIVVTTTSYSVYLNIRGLTIDRNNPQIYTQGVSTPHTQISTSVVGYTIEG